MIPLPVILLEFLLAFGAALLLANLVAVFRLRREKRWPPPGGRRRILLAVGIGLFVTLWSLASLVSRYDL